METIRTFRVRGQERYDYADLTGEFIPWKERGPIPDRLDWDGAPLDRKVRMFWETMVQGKYETGQQFLDKDGKLWRVQLDQLMGEYIRTDVIYSHYTHKYHAFTGDAARDYAEKVYFAGSYSKEEWKRKTETDINYFRHKKYTGPVGENWTVIKSFTEVKEKLSQIPESQPLELKDSEIEFVYNLEQTKDGKTKYSNKYSLPAECQYRFDLAMDAYLSGRKDIQIEDLPNGYINLISNTQ